MSTIDYDRRAAEPFRFTDYEGLVMPTGKRAANLRDLAEQVRTVPPEVIHHHLHRTFLLHRFGPWDYPNDFARWAAHSLEDLALAEKLAVLDPAVDTDMDAAREALVDLLEEHLEDLTITPTARRGFEFHFASGHFIALPSGVEVWTLGELRAAIGDVPLSSIYFHFHEARLRAPDPDIDDFSLWIEQQLDAPALVRAIRSIDFYFFSLPDLRDRLRQLLGDGR